MDSSIVELWSLGTKRCFITASEAEPPFAMHVYDGDTLVSRSVFDEQDPALALALDALDEADKFDEESSARKFRLCDMPPTDAEILVARLARMKALIDALEAECDTGAEQHQRFLRLKGELEAARLSLQLDTQ
jgi:hypothetical protein